MTPTEMTPKQQWVEQIRSAGTVLVITHTNPDGDALGSSLALKLALEKLGKEVTVAVASDLPDHLSFLPAFGSIQTDLSLRKDLLVVVDESQAKVANVTLKRVSDTKLMLVITPEGGLLTPSNLRVEEGSFDVDLIIALDCADADRMGRLYSGNPTLFYDVPVINVDHHPGNANFGKVNIVDLTASSTAEILVSLLEILGKDIPNLIDADIATALLTGVTTDTDSFQNSNTTPKSLTVAAQLVAAGARQQEIIKTIYKTRTLSTLRLWGRALSYIKEDRPLQFAWSVLSKADFVAAQAAYDESGGVIDELLKTASGMKFVLLMKEKDGALHGSFRSTDPSVDVSAIARMLGGGGHTQAAAFKIEGASIQANELEIINKIRAFLSGTPAETTPPVDDGAAPAAPAAPLEVLPAAERVLEAVQEKRESVQPLAVPPAKPEAPAQVAPVSVPTPVTVAQPSPQVPRPVPQQQPKPQEQPPRRTFRIPS